MAGLLRALLRFFFRLLYNQFAWAYDWVSSTVSFGQWRAWQRTGLSRLRGRRVLEIAHGTGDLLLDLTALGFEVTGLDLSRAMGRQAGRKLRAHGLAVPLVRARVQALPFADQAFPSLLATFPTDFIVDPPALAEFNRVLQPGGVLVSVPVAQITGPGLADRLAGWLFQVTGQSATDWFAPVLERYAEAGFTTRIERVPLPRSLVTLIVAEKAWAAGRPPGPAARG
jgi:ubiquinone/menaquinone biosynthesis C-methylase UbiE